MELQRLPHMIMGCMLRLERRQRGFEVFSPRWRSVRRRDAKCWCQSEFFWLCVELFYCQSDLETELCSVALYRSLCLSVFFLREIADRTTWYLDYMSSTSRRKRLGISSIYFYSNSGDAPRFNPQFKFSQMRLWFSTQCADISTLI